MESRLGDLNKINFNIMRESEKLTKYLGVIHDKCEDTIFLMQSLIPSNFLRKYSSTFEYLNKFNMKLVDINCIFELFFLELGVSLTNDPNNIQDLSSASELNLQSQLENNLLQDHLQNNDNLSEKCEFIIQSNSMQQNENFSHELKRSFSENHPQNNDILSEKCESNSTQQNKNSLHEIERSSSETHLKLEDNVEINNKQKINFESIAINDFIAHNFIDHLKENITPANQTGAKNSNENEDYLTGVVSSQHTTNSSDSIVVETQLPKQQVELFIKPGMLDENSIFARINARENQHHANIVPIPDLRPMIKTKKYNNNYEYSDENSTSSGASNNILQNEAIIAVGPAKESRLSIEARSQHTRQMHTIHFKDTKDSIETNKKSNLSNEPRLKHTRENDFDVKSAVLPTEEDMCYISHVESPYSFYIQIISEDNTLIDYLSEQIEEVLPNLRKFHIKKEARELIIDYCVFYLDECKTWYRGLILDWKQDNVEFVAVQRVDYGDKFDVPLISIRQSIPYFFSLPIMAKECELAWVKPINNEKEWSKNSIECFKNILYPDSATLFFVSFVEIVGHRLIVDLRSNEITSLAAEFITSGHAVDAYVEDKNDNWSNDFMIQQVIHSQGFSQKELNMTEEEKLSQLALEDSDEEVTDPTIAVAHYKPKDERDICRIFLAKGHCFKGDNCRFSHKALNPDGWTTDKEQIHFDTLSKLRIPAAGQEIALKIVSIVNLNSFYVAFKNWQSYSVSFSDSIKTIKELVTMINDPTEIKHYKRLKVIPALGELILVKYANNSWQRGKVLECFEFGNRVELDVFLVDLGIVLQHVNMKEVRSIQEKHLCLPFQTMLCFLANIQLKENATEEQIEMGIDYLEMHILRKTLMAKVHSSVTLTVELFTQSGENVGEELLRAELVEKCDMSFLPADDISKQN